MLEEQKRKAEEQKRDGKEKLQAEEQRRKEEEKAEEKRKEEEHLQAEARRKEEARLQEQTHKERDEELQAEQRRKDEAKLQERKQPDEDKPKTPRRSLDRQESKHFSPFQPLLYNPKIKPNTKLDEFNPQPISIDYLKYAEQITPRTLAASGSRQKGEQYVVQEQEQLVWG